MRAPQEIPAFGIGSVGNKVADLQERLAALDYTIDPAENGSRFGDSTAGAVREFQQRAGLTTDGIVGPETWETLVAAGHQLGDRLLYHRSPMLRGDDVSELQSCLNSIGFEAGAVDGVFGPETAGALREFQRNIGGTVDGVFGPEAAVALKSLGAKAEAVAGGPPAERLRGPSTISGRRILVDPRGVIEGESGAIAAASGLTEARAALMVAEELLLDLRSRGAAPLLSRSPGENPGAEERAFVANDAAVDAVVSIGFGWLDDPAASGVACYYFAGNDRESSAGKLLAELCQESVVAATGLPDCRAHGRNWTILRRTKAPAVVIELAFLSNPDDAALVEMVSGRRRFARALGGALANFFSPPGD